MDSTPAGFSGTLDTSWQCAYGVSKYTRATSMRTNIDLDDELVERALKLSGAKTKRQLVHLALEALVEKSRKKDLLDLVGKIELDPGFDHKKVRRSRHDAD